MARMEQEVLAAINMRDLKHLHGRIGKRVGELGPIVTLEPRQADDGCLDTSIPCDIAVSPINCILCEYFIENSEGQVVSLCNQYSGDWVLTKCQHRSLWSIGTAFASKPKSALILVLNRCPGIQIWIKSVPYAITNLSKIADRRVHNWASAASSHPPFYSATLSESRSVLFSASMDIDIMLIFPYNILKLETIHNESCDVDISLDMGWIHTLWRLKNSLWLVIAT